MKNLKISIKNHYEKCLVLMGGLLFSDALLADTWDTSTNATVNTMLINTRTTLTTAKEVAAIGVQLAGIIVFAASAYRIYKIRKQHQEGSVGACFVGLVVGVVLFSASTFMGATKKSLVG